MDKSVKIELRGGGTATVSACDAHLVREYTWRPGGTKGRYAVALVKNGDSLRTIYLHRLVIGAGPGEVIDHISGDPLDCRRGNLRRVTASENCANRATTTNATGFRGVAYYPDRRRYQARIERDGVYRGPFRHTAEQAARDADALLRGLYGSVATLNFPGPGERGIRRPGSAEQSTDERPTDGGGQSDLFSEAS